MKIDHSLAISCLVILVAVIAVCGNSNCSAQETDFSSLELRIPSRWEQLPDWAIRDLLFDTEQYFGIPDEENRESLYLKALVQLDFIASFSLIPDHEKIQDEIKKKFEAERKIDGELHELYELLFEKQSELDPATIAKGRELVQRYQRGFELLKLAQKRPSGFFRQAIDTQSFSPHLSRETGWKLMLRCLLDLNSDEAIESVEICLQFQQDLVPLGEMVTQLTASGIEGTCIDYMVLPILNNPKLEIAQLDRLIRVLKKHRDSISVNDSFVQAARYEHLMFKRLFHELETKTYLPRGYASEIWGDEIPVPVLMTRELTQFRFYSANIEEVDKAIDKLSSQSGEIGDSVGKAKAAARELPDPSAFDSMMLGPLLAGSLDAMTKEDYENEVKVLATRYRQIEAASKLPFPSAIQALMEFEKNWTTDESWQSTKILKWFSPKKKLAGVCVRNQLRTDAVLCLAAVRRWQLANNGQNPVDLSAALQAASIVAPPIDPHSGQPLKMLVGNKPVIYSVGPDGTDDQANFRVGFWKFSPEDKGDIVFTFESVGNE